MSVPVQNSPLLPLIAMYTTASSVAGEGVPVDDRLADVANACGLAA